MAQPRHNLPKGRVFDGIEIARQVGARIRADSASPEDAAPRRVLSHTLSPVHRLERLEHEIGGSVRLYVKRDDMLRPMFGNKLRYIEYVFGAYDALDADSVVHCGGLTSNYLAQLAMAGSQEAVPIHLIMTGERPAAPQGNPLLAEIFGATVRYQTGSCSALKASLGRELAAAGGRPLLIDPPFTNHSAILGYLRAWRELRLQIEAGLMPMPDHIVLCSAGNCYLGLRIGADRDGVAVAITAVPAIRFADTGLDSIAPDRRTFLLKKVREFGEFIGRELPTRDVEFDEDFVGPGYGIATADSVAAVRLVARTEGVLLDPIYTGKAMAALLAHVRAGRFRKNATVLFIHTGGSPNVFNYHQAFAEG